MNDQSDHVSVADRPALASSPTATSPETNIRLKETWWAWLRRSVPTAIVVCLLGGLAVIGHHTGWTMPKFSEVFGERTTVQDDWCPEHSVPESICVECNDKLLPKIKSVWCRKHGVHYCPFERPDVVQMKQVPNITPEDLARAQRALALKDRPENSSKCKIVEHRLQLASQDVMDKMGVDIALVTAGPVVESISASGEIVYEQPRVAPISVPVAGRVWYVTEQGMQGTEVKRGDLLALVDAADVGKAKAELLQAAAQLELKNKAMENLKALEKQNITVPTPRMQEAESAQREAQIRLLGAQQVLVNLGLPMDLDSIKAVPAEELARRIHFFGIPEQLSKRLDPKTTTANLFPILAPRDGVVTAAKVTPGETVEPSKTMFVVADTSQMWVVLNVRLDDAKYLRIRDPKTGRRGQEVRFTPDGGGQEVRGELVWRNTQVDERTRTLQVRAEVPNKGGVLLANTFGTGEIVLREEKEAPLVPSEAVHWEGDCQVVFVRDKNFLEPGGLKVFHVRNVRIGVKTSATTEIIAGLLPGEVVASKNSASLRAELLKNNLGAG